jgi:gamma-glutamylcyclotransferase (GGCT)/AIG2-like uncharacterized protein YtfP
MTPQPQPQRDAVAEDIVFLFVYGTLKRGEPGHELMRDARFVATVMKTHLRWIRDAEYPSCIETEDPMDFVVGEIWAVHVRSLPLLDDYEGENYRRVQLKNSNLLAYVLKENTADEFAETT